MARYKAYDLNQTKMIPLSYADQIVEGSFEHALGEIVEGHLDLGPFESKRCANPISRRGDRAGTWGPCAGDSSSPTSSGIWRS